MRVFIPVMKFPDNDYDSKSLPKTYKKKLSIMYAVCFTHISMSPQKSQQGCISILDTYKISILLSILLQINSKYMPHLIKSYFLNCIMTSYHIVAFIVDLFHWKQVVISMDCSLQHKLPFFNYEILWFKSVESFFLCERLAEENLHGRLHKVFSAYPGKIWFLSHPSN